MSVRTTPPTTLAQVTNGRLLKQTRKLFVQYARSIKFALDFDEFERELGALPGDYAPPRGRLIAALTEDHVAGCIALKPIDDTTCEMRRLYVIPEDRTHSIGRALASEAIAQARGIGYSTLIVNTIPSMTAGIALCRSLGFVDDAGDSPNPIEGATTLHLDLS